LLSDLRNQGEGKGEKKEKKTERKIVGKISKHANLYNNKGPPSLILPPLILTKK
jgi:hypothetical protein